MEPLAVITGRAAPLDRSDVDTDQIIPAAWLKKTTRTGYGEALFSQWRLDPAFILNQAERAGARILVAGPNFGCGSSREHAAWALRDYGFAAVIAPGFGDIFRNNAPNGGLVPVQPAPDTVTAVMRAVTEDARTEITVNVADRTLDCAAAGVDRAPFFLEEGAHDRLVNGLDLLDLTLRSEELISAYERERAPWLPTGNGRIAGESPSRQRQRS